MVIVLVLAPSSAAVPCVMAARLGENTAYGLWGAALTRP
jgi:hypothetical protein